MRKWKYNSLSHLGTVTAMIEGEEIEAENRTEFYTADDIHALLQGWQGYAWKDGKYVDDIQAYFDRATGQE